MCIYSVRHSTAQGVPSTHFNLTVAEENEQQCRRQIKDIRMGKTQVNRKANRVRRQENEALQECGWKQSILSVQLDINAFALRTKPVG